MSVSIEITPAQAGTLASLTEREGALAVRQLSPDGIVAGPGDIYATPHATAHGYRIAADGNLTEIGETLPAPD